MASPVSMNPTGPVGLPLTLDPRRLGTEAPRIGLPGNFALTGLAQYVQAQFTGLRINCPNTGYPDGVGTKPSYAAPATVTVVVAAPPSGKKYQLTLRCRAVIERCGVTSPSSTLAGGKVAVGGTPQVSAAKYFKVTIGATSYYLNYKAGATIDPIESLDYTFTVDLPASQTTVYLDVYSGTSYRQRDNTVEQVVGPVGLSPYPSYYAGQFVQMDCTGCALVNA